MKSRKERLNAGIEFEGEVERYCRHYCVAVARNGTEHTHPEFMENIRNNTDRQSKLIRFAPDGVMLKPTGEILHWEAKYSINLEKDAYETYMAHSNIGYKIVLFVKTPGFKRVYLGYMDNAASGFMQERWG